MLETLKASGAVASDEQIAEYERQQRRDLRREALAASGINLPDRDRQMILSGKLDRNTPSAKAIASWARGAPKPGASLEAATPGIIVLCGGMGTGKTVAGGWWLSHVIGRALTIHEAARIYDRWKRALSRGDEHERDLERLARIDNLLLDELGQEDDRDATTVREVFHWIVDRRQSARKRTAILSNLSLAAFARRFETSTYDKRTADRLRASGIVVELDGESMRGGARALP